MRIQIARLLTLALTLLVLALAAVTAIRLNPEPHRASYTPATGIVLGLAGRAGPVLFDHAAHIARPASHCTDCHHLALGADTGNHCGQCHLPQSQALPDRETAFHQTCVGCHRARARDHADAGPHRRCSGCHNQENWANEKR